MLIDQYPAQEPLSEVGQRYGDECWRRSGDLAGAEEHGYGDDPYQRLLVYRAQKADGRVLIFWHGGGWTSGYKEWMGFMGPVFAERGVTFVSPGYRLAPQHVFPAALQDCIEALRWTHANASRFGGSADRIYLGGHSAGGHYAALLAVRRDWQATAGLPIDVVRGCLPLSGVFDFTEGSGLSARPRFLGPSGNEREASPIHNLQPPLPKILVAHGSEDFPHLVRQAEAFCRALRAAGGEVEHVVMNGRNHFTASYAGGEADGPWVGAADRFMT
jgi:arylformamidase